MNFLRWAHLYHVISFVRRNLKAIEADMMATLIESKQRRLHGKDTTKRKRTELSKAPRSKCTVYLVPRNLIFED